MPWSVLENSESLREDSYLVRMGGLGKGEGGLGWGGEENIKKKKEAKCILSATLRKKNVSQGIGKAKFFHIQMDCNFPPFST